MVRTNSRWAALITALAMEPGLCSAQLFDPPAPPSPDNPSRVRGLYDPAAQPPIPSGPIGAEAAPSATFSPPAPSTSVASLIGGDESLPDGAPPAADAPQPITPTLQPKAQPIEGSEIIARVDGEVILASDVLWQVRQLIKMARQPIPPEHVAEAETMLTQNLMMGMLDTKLLYADFRRTVPAENLPKISESLDEPFRESEIPRLIGMLKLQNQAELEAVLESSGTSLKDVQRQFVEKQIASKWLQEKAPRPNPITYEQLKAYYDDHLKEYEFEPKVQWEELMVRFDRCGGNRDVAWQQLCEMGNSVWQAAQANPDLRGPAFGAVARAKSHGFTAAQGGLHEWTTPGSLRCEALNEALNTLAVGQMSSGIESELGFHIVRVLERKPGGRVPFTEAQADIRKLLEGEQKVTLVESELTRLRKGARVWTLFHGDLSGPQFAELLDEQSQRR
jgi:hypothetical protein